MLPTSQCLLVTLSLQEDSQLNEAATPEAAQSEFILGFRDNGYYNTIKIIIN